MPIVKICSNLKIKQPDIFLLDFYNFPKQTKFPGKNRAVKFFPNFYLLMATML